MHTVWINWYADDSLKIPLVAYDPCWAMQHLSLHCLEDGGEGDSCRKAKHGVVFFWWQWDIGRESPNGEEALNTFICPQHGSSSVCLVVSTEPCLNILDHLSSCVHLEKITPTLTRIFVGSLAHEELYAWDFKCSVFGMLWNVEKHVLFHQVSTIFCKHKKQRSKRSWAPECLDKGWASTPLFCRTWMAQNGQKITVNVGRWHKVFPDIMSGGIFFLRFSSCVRPVAIGSDRSRGERGPDWLDGRRVN